MLSLLITRPFSYKEQKIKSLKDSWSDFYRDHENLLQSLYPGISSDIFFRDLVDILRYRLKNSLISLELSEFTLSELDSQKLEEHFLKGTPLATLMGFSEFYHHRFYVNEHVLIPRPETEYMVDLLVQEFKGKAQRVLDVGTGSGVIILSLLDAGVGKNGVGVDISTDALKVAEINRQRLRLKHKLTLIQSDRLTKAEGIFDLIVSNPPYIKATSHKSLVHASVDKHEPHEALYLPDDYYVLWFEDFFQEVRAHLNGTFMMEGHELELEDQAKMLGRLGFQKIQVLNDLTGTKRYVRAEFRN
jgi:release factor glutamine methyltransferase